jgi:hypothetical protein
VHLSIELHPFGVSGAQEAGQSDSGAPDTAARALSVDEAWIFQDQLCLVARALSTRGGTPPVEPACRQLISRAIEAEQAIIIRSGLQDAVDQKYRQLGKGGDHTDCPQSTEARLNKLGPLLLGRD